MFSFEVDNGERVELSQLVSMRCIGKESTRVSYLRRVEVNLVSAVADVSIHELFDSLKASASNEVPYMGRRFVDLKRESDDTTYAKMCKLCGEVHNIYHQVCLCHLVIPLTKEARAIRTERGLELKNQKLYLNSSDVKVLGIVGLRMDISDTYTGQCEVYNIQKMEGCFPTGKVDFGGATFDVCVQYDESGGPDLSDIENKAREWTWAYIDDSHLAF